MQACANVTEGTSSPPGSELLPQRTLYSPLPVNILSALLSTFTLPLGWTLVMRALYLYPFHAVFQQEIGLHS